MYIIMVNEAQQIKREKIRNNMQHFKNDPNRDEIINFEKKKNAPTSTNKNNNK